jgi:hypothetical protein
MIGFTILDPDSDEGQYRLTTYRYLMNNKQKFPEFHAFMELEKKQKGHALGFITHLGLVMTACFNENTTTAECANKIEAIILESRKLSEEVFFKHIMPESETKH